MTLRLRCIRCGDLCMLDPTDPYGWGICMTCFRKWLSLPVGSWQYRRFGDRCSKGAERHPTYIALAVALGALESVPHGALDVDVDGNPNDEDLWASTQCP